MAHKTIENLQKLAGVVDIDLVEAITSVAATKAMQLKPAAKAIMPHDFESLTENLDLDSLSDIIAYSRILSLADMGTPSVEEYDEYISILNIAFDDLSAGNNDLGVFFLFKTHLNGGVGDKNRFQYDEAGLELLERVRQVQIPEPVTVLIDAIDAVLDSDEVFDDA